ncbi:AAA family ATPase [Rhizobium ruizarguesonis]|nr:AAA family ATPase [Rhizobium ruizarguesonis]
MTEIFLSRIDITNFRTFGDFGVEIPAGPGLLLLSGPNGLGKSTFFDGIEWALTGRVNRFTPYLHRGKTSIPESSYLTRRDAKPNTHKVSLGFSEGDPVVRTAGSGTSDSQILDLLAYPRRGRVADLGTHLALTHFLGQTERQRFTSRIATDQWETLKGPSGVDRMEEIKTRLRGRSTSLAFGRRVRDEQAQVAELERQIAEWQGWQSRLDRLRQGVRATGRLTPEEIAQRSGEIEAQFHKLLGTQGPELVGESSSELLVRLKGLIADRQEDLLDREKALDDVTSLLDAYQAARVAATSDQPIMVRLRKDVADLSAATGAASERLTATGKERAAQVNIVSRLVTEVSQLEATRADMLRRVEIAEQLSAANTEFLAFTDEGDKLREAISDLDATLVAHSEAAREALQLSVLSDQAKALFDEHQAMLQLEAAAQRQTDALRGVLAEAENSAPEYETRVSGHRDLVTGIEIARQSVEEAQRHATAIASAVAALAVHIHEGDTICPVCRTNFPKGDLKLLADAAATSGNVTLQAAQQQLEDLVKGEPAASQSVSALRTVVVDRPAAVREAEARTKLVAENARGVLLQKSGLDASIDLAEAVASRKATAEANLADGQRRLEALDARAAGATQRRADLLVRLESLTQRQSTAAQRVTDLQIEDRSCSERISSRAVAVQTVPEAAELLSFKRTDLEAARTRSSELDALGSTYDAELKEAQARRTTAEQALREAEVARSQAQADVDRLASNWTSLDLPGEPGRSTLDGVLDRIRALRASLATLESRRANLAVSNQDSVLEEELLMLEKQMAETGGEASMNDPQAYVGTLREKLKVVTAALQLSKAAHEAVNRYTARLAEKTEGYNEAILKPLNQRILEFNAAMLSTPGASVQFGANARVDRTDFAMGLHYDDAIVDSFESAKGLAPQLVLSEGQMAANGFSILCAVSTAYRWSRWRALLLDDPLQHNDIIHTAAFVDLMRNLVEEEKYQLIMSSHDRAESDFIGRKFDAAGLSCTTVYLTAPSDEGVGYEPPLYNDPARALMQTRARTDFASGGSVAG